MHFQYFNLPNLPDTRKINTKKGRNINNGTNFARAIYFNFGKELPVQKVLNVTYRNREHGLVQIQMRPSALQDRSQIDHYLTLCQLQ